MSAERKRTASYKSTYPSLLYRFFVSYEGPGAPSFGKFARQVGVTAEDLELFRKHKRFEKAYRECSEIRRDYLIDNALTRRFDPSFVKFLLDNESCADEGENLSVRIEVADQ